MSSLVMDKIELTPESYLHRVEEGGVLQAAMLGSIERFCYFLTIVFWEHRTLKIPILSLPSGNLLASAANFPSW